MKQKPLRFDSAGVSKKTSQTIVVLNAEFGSNPCPTFLYVTKLKLFQRHKMRFGQNAPAELKLSRGKRNKKFCVFEDGKLVAASFFEMGVNTSYGYYAIFDPEIEWRSLGIFTMLKEIEYATEQGNEFYYLGYAFDKPTLYDYKKRFHGLESYDWKTGKWVNFERLV